MFRRRKEESADKGISDIFKSTRKFEEVEKHSMHICILDIMKGEADLGELTLERRAKRP